MIPRQLPNDTLPPRPAELLSEGGVSKHGDDRLGDGGVAGRLARTPVIWHLRDFPPPGFAGRL
ncbi:MAG TPA: hypothetical protein VGU22_19110, partial [Methylomirabilota bacterium]|nr:hypothetical protein [Methylomirabilota bacterium]